MNITYIVAYGSLYLSSIGINKMITCALSYQVAFQEGERVTCVKPIKFY